MPLKGQARTDYMREYMRNKRAGKTTTKPAKRGNKPAAKAAPVIDTAALSMTAQQKLDAAIQREVRRLQDANEIVRQKIRKEVHAEMFAWLKNQLDGYNEKEKHYDIVMKARRGILSRNDYRAVLRCLHPDTVSDPELKPRYAHAFNLFTKMEKAFLSETDSPTKGSALPKTVEELRQRRAEYEAQKKANRKTGSKVSRR